MFDYKNMKNNNGSIALRHVKKIMSHKEMYQHGSYNIKFLMILSLFVLAVFLFNGYIANGLTFKVFWFIAAGISLSNFTKYFMIKGFIEFADELDKQKIEQAAGGDATR